MKHRRKINQIKNGAEYRVKISRETREFIKYFLPFVLARIKYYNLFCAKSLKHKTRIKFHPFEQNFNHYPESKDPSSSATLRLSFKSSICREKKISNFVN